MPSTRVLVAFLALAATGLPNAAFAAVDADAQGWAAAILQGPMSGNWRVYLEVQPRFTGTFGNLGTTIVRPAAYVHLSPEISLWAGYAWQPVLYPTASNEHRLWQQLQHSSHLGRWQITHRLRLEERFLSTAPSGPAWRFRYSLRTLYALDAAARWKTVIQDEVFFNMNSVSGGSTGGFDQNRLFLGIHHKISDAFSFDALYLFNYVNRPTAPADRINHAAVLNAYVYF